MTPRKLTLAAAALAVLASCAPKGVETRPTIQYVRDIIALKALPEHGIVASYDPASAARPICIIGSEAECAAYSALMEGCDLLDNVTGRARPDGLPDFSGEVLMSIADEIRGPFAGADPDSFRERTVRDVVAAADSVYYLSTFDKIGLGRRPGAKLVVLASPEMSAFGKFDADTLFEAFGKPSPVVSPLDLMLEKVLASAVGPVNVGILRDSSSVSEAALQEVFANSAAEQGSVLYTGTACADSAGVLAAFLDSYVGAGYTKPLSALLVLDPAVDLGALRSELGRIRVPLSNEFLAYASVVTPDFSVLESRETAALESLRILRATNRFTHNIHYPKTSFLKTAFTADGSTVLMTDVQKQH